MSLRLIHLIFAASALYSQGVWAMSPKNAGAASAARHSHHGTLQPSGSLLQTSSSVLEAKRRAKLQRIENLKEYKDGHLAFHSSLDPTHEQTLASGITADSYSAMLHKFVDSGVPSRYIHDKGNRKAADFIMQELKDAGFEVKEYPLSIDGKPKTSSFMDTRGYGHDNDAEQTQLGAGNIVAFKKGTDLSHEAFMMAAHFDSVNWKEMGKAAPGVDDNGSGIAGVLSVGKALKDHQPRRSVMLVAFNAEEEGLLGSKSFASTVAKSKTYGDIKGAIVVDEIAFPGRKQYDRGAIFETVGCTEGNQAIVDTLAHSMNDPLGGISHHWVNCDGFGSDHVSLVTIAGIPTVLLIERDDEYHADLVGHSDKDTFDGLSMPYGAAMSRLALKTVLKGANPAAVA